MAWRPSLNLLTSLMPFSQLWGSSMLWYMALFVASILWRHGAFYFGSFPHGLSLFYLFCTFYFLLFWRAHWAWLCISWQACKQMAWLMLSFHSFLSSSCLLSHVPSSFLPPLPSGSAEAGRLIQCSCWRWLAAHTPHLPLLLLPLTAAGLQAVEPSQESEVSEYYLVWAWRFCFVVPLTTQAALPWFILWLRLSFSPLAWQHCHCGPSGCHSGYEHNVLGEFSNSIGDILRDSWRGTCLAWLSISVAHSLSSVMTGFLVDYLSAENLFLCCVSHSCVLCAFSSGTGHFKAFRLACIRHVSLHFF